MSKEREKRRKERYLNFLEKKWPALAAATSTLAGAGILFLFLRRRTRDETIKEKIDKIVEGTLLANPKEASNDLGRAAILAKVTDLAQDLKELAKTPEGRKTLAHFEDAWHKVSPGEGSLEQKITTLAAFIAGEIEKTPQKK